MKSMWGQSGKYLRIRRRRFDVSPRLARLILTAILVMIAVIFIAGEGGLWNLWTAQEQFGELERDIGRLERENSQLRAEIEFLRNDPFAAEKVAREMYGYLRPGDRVYRIITLPEDGPRDEATPVTLDRGR